ncbi:TetR/AcrR family transcriptional regulator [Rhodocytophaga rosea]|uniref:TetR/AcrR family transcriptional regulator n=1 Tax=Rhodocytophaga rosea TaxID=2704465 RepID=A0A6C0GI14_9BACT|nr:TetR/AcrR family transcriptional regulator [Rhodocytophaga rosea]QHT67701.1 TetR/AcrR family transcriptional regulator [Rhodocytophaga rosea]
MSKSERTKKFIIEKAAPIFNTKGFAGTSLSDLTEATGLTKGSIYGNFENKEEIAIHVFKYGVARMKQAMEIKLDTVAQPSQQIYAFLDFFLEYVFEPPVSGGCIILNTAVEADDNQPVLKKHVSQQLTSLIKYVQSLLEGTSIDWEQKYEYKPETLSYAIFSSIEGAVMISRVQNNIRPMQQVVSYWKKQLKQLETQ